MSVQIDTINTTTLNGTLSINQSPTVPTLPSTNISTSASSTAFVQSVIPDLQNKITTDTTQTITGSNTINTLSLTTFVGDVLATSISIMTSSLQSFYINSNLQYPTSVFKKFLCISSAKNGLFQCKKETLTASNQWLAVVFDTAYPVGITPTVVACSGQNPVSNCVIRNVSNTGFEIYLPSTTIYCMFAIA